MISGNKINRVSIEYFDGVNTGVASNLSKKNELSYAVNARSKSIGSLEKREGSHRLGDSIVGVANYGIFYFSNSINNGFYRVTKVGSTTSLYSLDDSANRYFFTVTAANATIGATYTNNSQTFTVLATISADTTLITSGTGAPATSGTLTKATGTGDATIAFSANYTAKWTIYAGNGTSLTAANVSHAMAENCCFMVNGTDANRYIDSTQYFFTVTAANATVDATYTNNGITFTVLATIVGDTTLTASGAGAPAMTGTLTKATGTGDATIAFSAFNLNVVTSAISTGHLKNSPVAYKINYYKDKLYLADYTVGSTRYKNGIMSSSMPLGILSLVDGDHAAADCEADDWIKVTDTKYIYATDTIDVYRGNEKVADITVKAKDEHRFQINAITFAGSNITLNSADEIWVDGTQAGTTSKKFRWAGNPSSGVNVKQYDTFFLTGGQNDAITMLTNIGDVMLIANKHNISIWNNSSLQNMDIGIGCVSERGFVKSNGVLFFLGYKGVYSTTGGMPKLESAKVQEYFDGSTKAGKEAGAMGAKGRSIFVSLGDITLYHPDGSVRETLVDAVLEKNLQQGNWFCHTGISATQFANYITSSNTDELIFADDGANYNLFELFYAGSVTDDESGTPKEILLRIDSNNLPLSKSFEKIVNPLEIIVESERGHNIQIFISLDNASFYPLEGNAIKGCSILKIKNRDVNESTPVRCRNIAFSIRDYSKSPCRITRVALIYNPTNEEEESKPISYGK